jgi:hypothetical protein
MNDTIALIANLALALSFIVGLIFGIAQVQAAARDSGTYCLKHYGISNAESLNYCSVK